jgi:hypothetical protein
MPFLSSAGAELLLFGVVVPASVVIPVVVILVQVLQGLMEAAVLGCRVRLLVKLLVERADVMVEPLVRTTRP